MHRHVLKRLKEVMRVGPLGDGEKEDVSLSITRQEVKGGAHKWSKEDL